jgi:endo-1,4-beta-xylanase
MTVASLLLLASFISCRGGSVDAPETNSSKTLRLIAESRGVVIGAAASAGYLEDAEYAQILGSEFGQLQPENDMKFVFIHPRIDSDPNPYDFTATDKVVAFAQAHKMLVRGHTLVWHNQLPDWVKSDRLTPAHLSGILQGHISTLVRRYGASVYAWDVVNEAFNDDGRLRDTIWYNKPGIGFAERGTQYIAQALVWAHEANPKAQLFYNDMGAEIVNEKSDAIFAMARDFKQHGAPLDGIGFEMHVDLSFDEANTLASLTRNLKRFADLGLIIHITELDVRLADASTGALAAQADLYWKITGICLDILSCRVVQLWGVTDRYSWIPWFFPGYDSALLWDANYQKKPAYRSVQQALLTRP